MHKFASAENIDTQNEIAISGSTKKRDNTIDHLKSLLSLKLAQMRSR